MGGSFISPPIDRFIGLTCSLALRVVAVLWHAARCKTKDRQQRPGLFDDDEVRQSVVHARQDLKLIAFLGAIVLMLGVVADRVH